MTLLELRAVHPGHFYEHQREKAWWDGEAFALRDDPPIHAMPRGFVACGEDVASADDNPSAVQYAALYVRHPSAEIWRKRLWTCDSDTDAQTVYVTDNGKGFEVHRLLRTGPHFGVALW